MAVPTTDNDDGTSPSSGHLGRAWEAAVIVVFREYSSHSSTQSHINCIRIHCVSRSPTTSVSPSLRACVSAMSRQSLSLTVLSLTVAVFGVVIGVAIWRYSKERRRREEEWRRGEMRRRGVRLWKAFRRGRRAKRALRGRIADGRNGDRTRDRIVDERIESGGQDRIVDEQSSPRMHLPPTLLYRSPHTR
ncbi:hypothetical protein NMY22_g981 [Coprinellus aureogranulatus]|nr:hypothetical protein NMY22_g981 [Coprinellus aureogranulatus]